MQTSGVLVAAHGNLLGLLWRELLAACTRYDVPYPEATEQEIRDHLRRELDLEIPS